MHDPLVLLWAIRRPPISPREWRRALRLDRHPSRGWSRLPHFLDIWHREPGGRDSGQVCGRNPKRYRWHIHHYHLRFWPVFNLRRWLFQPCARCGRRFRYRDARMGHMSSDKTWHNECMSLGHNESTLLVMTETMDRLLGLWGIESKEQLREVVVRPDERRDQFLLWYRPWERIERYRGLPREDRWRAPNEHLTDNRLSHIEPEAS